MTTRVGEDGTGQVEEGLETIISYPEIELRIMLYLALL